MHSGLKMIINGHKRVALAHVADIAVAHQRHIRLEAVRMVLAMEMVMHQIWAPYQHPHRVCSIRHRVSISLFHFRSFIRRNRAIMLRFVFTFYKISLSLLLESCA